ncbi:MAG: hypothetical protein C5B60_04105 [Chloroflexi bacterium]|nr:MAG: hypothetical protein C5B60_04105 [Chloroflexota bacterium]
MTTNEQWIEHKQRQKKLRDQRAWQAEANPPHEQGCACWDCVFDLHAWVAYHQALMRAEMEMQCASAVFTETNGGVNADDV